MNLLNRLVKTAPSIIGITGTPGTGKKSIGQIIAINLGYKFVDLNKIALESDAVLSNEKEDLEVNTKKLRRHVLRQIKGQNVVLVGHLLPDLLSKGEIKFVAVLRCSPFELEKRYSERHYSATKIKDNVSSEILDICFAEAVHSFGTKVISEFDTTGRQSIDVANEIIQVYNRHKKRSFGNINWLSSSSAKIFLKKYLD